MDTPVRFVITQLPSSFRRNRSRYRATSVMRARPSSSRSSTRRSVSAVAVSPSTSITGLAPRWTTAGCFRSSPGSVQWGGSADRNIFPIASRPRKTVPASCSTASSSNSAARRSPAWSSMARMERSITSRISSLSTHSFRSPTNTLDRSRRARVAAGPPSGAGRALYSTSTSKQLSVVRSGGELERRGPGEHRFGVVGQEHAGLDQAFGGGARSCVPLCYRAKCRRRPPHGHCTE